MAQKDLLWAAWTTPVNPLELVVSLETFNATHNQAAAFKACQNMTLPNILHKLPTELVAMVTDHLCADEKNKQEQDWKHKLDCCKLECDADDHLTDAENLSVDAVNDSVDHCRQDPRL